MRIARLIAVFVFAVSLFAESAADLYYAGRKAEKEGAFSRAYLLYSQAYALDPGNRQYWARCQALRTRAILESRSAPLPDSLTSTEIEEAAPTTPSTISDSELAEAKKLLPPKELNLSPALQDFDLKATPRDIFEKVAKQCGVDVVFDGAYPASAPPLAFRLAGVSCRDALRAVEAVTGSFIAPANERMFLAVQDTPQKRTEVDPVMALIVPIPDPVSVQEAQELGRAVQQAMEIPKFAIDTQRRLVLIRDRVSKVHAAQALFQQLLYGKAQVVIDLEFLEVSESSSLSYGLNLQTKFPLAYLGGFLRSPSSIPSGFTNLLTFGGGMTLFGLGITNAELFASMSKNSSQILLQTEIRSVEGMPATLHIGDKYPVITSIYSIETGSTTGQSYTPPPTFTFEDLGLILKVTPKVHGATDISLGIESEFKVLTGKALNGIPIISNRKLASTVRVRDGQWAIVSGLLNDTDSRGFTGLYGLATMPGLGPLMRQNTRDSNKSQILLVIRPRIVNLPIDEMIPTRGFWVGSETRPLSSL